MGEDSITYNPLDRIVEVLTELARPVSVRELAAYFPGTTDAALLRQLNKFVRREQILMFKTNGHNFYHLDATQAPEDVKQVCTPPWFEEAFAMALDPKTPEETVKLLNGVVIAVRLVLDGKGLSTADRDVLEAQRVLVEKLITDLLVMVRTLNWVRIEKLTPTAATCILESDTTRAIQTARESYRKG